MDFLGKEQEGLVEYLGKEQEGLTEYLGKEFKNTGKSDAVPRKAFGKVPVLLKQQRYR